VRTYARTSGRDVLKYPLLFRCPLRA
jgi:hypothetical protein